MPSFRDLKGKPVDEIVMSRDVPGQPEAGEDMAVRAVVQQAVEKVRAAKPTPFPLNREIREGDRRVEPEPHLVDALLRLTNLPPEPVTGVPPAVALSAPVPVDVEAALQHLEASMALLYEECQHVMHTVVGMRDQVAKIRSRTERDAGRLAKMLEVLKQVE